MTERTESIQWSEFAEFEARGRRFKVPTFRSYQDGTHLSIQTLAWALYALDDPRVNAVMKAFDLTFFLEGEEVKP